MAMKLILRADVEHLGRLGDLVTVAPGYGRNFLIPRGLAMPATEGNIKVFELERKKLAAKRDALRAEAASFAEKLAAAKVVIIVRVGEGDKLYGSVTASHIADALAEQGLAVDRKKIVIAEPIRSIGEYTVAVKLHHDVKAEVSVSVAPRGGLPKAEPVKDSADAASEQGERAEG